MGLFDIFDDEEEEMIELQMTARSREEAIELTGDDTFYMGDDEDENND